MAGSGGSILGQPAKNVLVPWLRTELTAYLFSPRVAMEYPLVERRRKRKSKVQPSQRDRSKAKANREAERSAKAEGREFVPIPGWHPNQLRHSAATRLRREFGLDVARAVLGHSTPVVTEVYAELDGAKAAETMGRIG